MRTYRRMSNQRGALEGLPLYLIILIVVAAIVVAILVGWLSTLQHPAIGNVSYDVAGAGEVAVACNAQPCTAGNTANTGWFVQNTASNNCSFGFNRPATGGTNVLVITVTDKNGHPLGGVQVSLSASNGLQDIFASPALTVVSDSSGNAAFTSVTGDIAPGNPGGGTVSVTAAYSSGGLSTSGSSPPISVTPPSAWSC